MFEISASEIHLFSTQNASLRSSYGVNVHMLVSTSLWLHVPPLPVLTSP